MSHHKGFFGRYFRPNTIGIIVGSIGLGMLAVIVLPIWVWITCVAFSCIFFACRRLFWRI